MQRSDFLQHTRPSDRALIFGGTGVLMAAWLFWGIATTLASLSEESQTRPPNWEPVQFLMSSLNPAYAVASATAFQTAPSSIVIDDFDDLPVGGFPNVWKAWRGDDDYARNLYGIGEEAGNRYLKARDDGTSIIIRKKLDKWNPHEHPILSWRWRARALPENGDERVGSKNDSAVAVYVLLDQNFFRVPKTLKYVWSTTLPIGTRHRRDGIGRPNVIVLQSGEEKLGEWVTETINVYDDFIRTFGKEPPKRAIGIGVLTDGNATKTNSEGDYDDFVIHRYPDGAF